MMPQWQGDKKGIELSDPSLNDGHVLFVPSWKLGEKVTIHRRTYLRWAVHFAEKPWCDAEALLNAIQVALQAYGAKGWETIFGDTADYLRAQRQAAE